MNPWQILLLAGGLLNGLAATGLLLNGHSDLVPSVFAGALLPIVISGGLLFWAEKTNIQDAQQLQKINIIGFLVKVILFGVWAVIVINSGTLDMMTFIVMLLINFLAWHGVEAYYWPLFMAGNGQEKGENS